MRAPFQKLRLALMPVLLGAGVAHAGPADIMARLDAGEILCHTREARRSPVVAKAVIDAPPERVWPLVADCGRYERTMERIKKARIVSREGSRVVCEVTVDMPFPYSDMTAVTAAIHTVRDGTWSRRWHLLSGDYVENSGSWTLRRFRGDPGRTLLVYRIWAKPRAWIPAWIRKRAQRSAVPRMIERLRRLSRRAGKDRR